MQGQKTLSLSYNMHLFVPYLLNDSQIIRSAINFSKLGMGRIDPKVLILFRYFYSHKNIDSKVHFFNHLFNFIKTFGA